MPVVVIPLLKCKSEDPADVNNYRPRYLSKVLEVLEHAGLAQATRQVPVDGSQLVPSKHMGQKWPYLHSSKPWIFTVITTHLYTCAVLMQKNEFDRVNDWTLANKLLNRNVLLQIVKLFIFWYREQEFMVRWGNSLSMTLRCANWIRQGGQFHHCCRMNIQMT